MELRNSADLLPLVRGILCNSYIAAKDDPTSWVVIVRETEWGMKAKGLNRGD